MGIDIQRFEFRSEHDGTLSIESAVYQAIGAASMCWEGVEKAGVFQTEQAHLIAQALLAFLATDTQSEDT